MHLVVDASVAVKWLMPEQHSAAAKALLDSRNALFAPELLWAEVASVLVNRHLAGEFSLTEIQAGFHDLATYQVTIEPMRALAWRAIAMASATRRGVYDFFYLALAWHRSIRLVTADRTFYRRIADGPYADYISWIEDTA